jgi:hypothetical protein
MTTPKGMLPSANNRTGVQQIDVALDDNDNESSNGDQ